MNYYFLSSRRHSYTSSGPVPGTYPTQKIRMSEKSQPDKMKVK